MPDQLAFVQHTAIPMTSPGSTRNVPLRVSDDATTQTLAGGCSAPSDKQVPEGGGLRQELVVTCAELDDLVRFRAQRGTDDGRAVARVDVEERCRAVTAEVRQALADLWYVAGHQNQVFDRGYAGDRFRGDDAAVADGNHNGRF